MYNLDREKKLILILATPMVISAFFFIVIGQGLFASGASEEKKTDTTKNETIYEKRECKDGKCTDQGKKLIQFKGASAECENYTTEDARMKCYSENSQSAYACSNLEDKKEVQDCYEKRRGNIFNDNQGGQGTLVANKSITVDGAREYMTGFDCRGAHKIKTGADEYGSGAITFYDSSRDVRYGGDIGIGSDINLMSLEAGVYFGSDVEYGEKDVGNGAGQGIVAYDNFNGMNLNRCGDLKVLANHRQLLTIVGANRDSFGGTETEKGLEVNGDVKTDFMYFQGRFLKWSEPIRGHFILYYNDPPAEPSSCGLPDYKRDAQPHSTPSLGGDGPAGG